MGLEIWQETARIISETNSKIIDGERHALNVGRMAGLLYFIYGEEYEKDDSLTPQIAFIAGQLHDAGKMGRVELVNQKRKLSDEEMVRVKDHPEIGYLMLVEDETLPKVIPLGVRHHHENWDGSGYPFHLKGKDIPILARILRICDAMDAYRNREVDERRHTNRETKTYVRENSGKWFDPILVKLVLENFNDIMTEEPELVKYATPEKQNDRYPRGRIGQPVFEKQGIWNSNA